MCKALEYANTLFDTADEIKVEWKNLHSELSIADQKRNDIQHYIELSTLNAAQGYNAYRLLKEVLEERRNIKNKIEEMRKILDFINSSKLTDMRIKQSITNHISNKHDLNTRNIENKRYNVRVLTELFGNVIQ